MKLTAVLILALTMALSMVVATSAPSGAPTLMPTASPTPLPCNSYGTNKTACMENPACGWRGHNRQCTLVCKYHDQTSCTNDQRCKWLLGDKSGGSCKVQAVVNPGKGHGKGGNGGHGKGKGKGRRLDEGDDDDDEDLDQ